MKRKTPSLRLEISIVKEKTNSNLVFLILKRKCINVRGFMIKGCNLFCIVINTHIATSRHNGYPVVPNISGI